MSLLNYFDRKKAPPAIGTATPVIVVGENVPPSSITEVLSSTSDEDPVYVQVVEKTRSALARRKPDIDVEVVDVVDRSSVRSSGCAEDDRQQPIAVIQETYRPTWSQRIAPQSAVEVVGNDTSVKQLLSWLKAWRKRRKLVKDAPSPVAAPKRRQKSRQKKKKRRKKSNRIDSSSSSSSDDDWFDADPDFMPTVRNKARQRKRCHSEDEEDWLDEDEDAQQQLCSTVLLTGPHGCGKTAAVFACAQELGYEVLEVNSSSLRSGKQVLSLLQEATQSHQVSQKSVDAAAPAINTKAAAAMRSFFKPATSTPTSNAQQSNKSPNPSPSQPSPSTMGSGFAGPSLILFEEADVLFEEDKGFWTALLSVAETSKRPIIITAQEDCIPAGLPYLSFPMVAPEPHTISALLHDKSRELHAGNAVAPVRLDDISYAVAVCDGDLRRVMLNFDLWLSSGHGTESPVSSFKSWMSSQVDIRTRLAVDFANSRTVLLRHSLASSAEEISPAERYAQLNATVSLLEGQSAVDSLAAAAAAAFTYPPPCRQAGTQQPPSLSWQPSVASWWSATVKPGVLDAVPVQEADTIGQRLAHDLSIDLGRALADCAIRTATHFVSSADTTQEAKEDTVGPVGGDLANLDSGIASCGEETAPAHGSNDSGTTAAGRFSTLSAEQESEFQSRLVYYSDCLRWPHVPDIMACQSRSLTLDYLPMMRSVCRDQQLKKVNRVKRRFIHHFNTMEDDISIRLAQDHLLC
eukprot:scpid46863/ scgid2229/ ATPase family AAA domain-containing protein 5; Chromosome fragility-associated gene 1 protein